MNKASYKNSLERLLGIKQQIAFDTSASKDEYLYHIEKKFTKNEIDELKEGNAIPKDYKPDKYRK
jgi:hypothetical protein